MEGEIWSKARGYAKGKGKVHWEKGDWPYYMSNFITNLIEQTSKWAAPDNAKKKKHPYDHIESFLSELVITREAIDTSGGYLAYWEAALVSRPMVARMALDYISAPGMLFIPQEYTD